MAYDRAHRTLGSVLDTRVWVNPTAVVLEPCVGDGADFLARLDGWVVGCEDGGDGTDNGTDSLVHRLVLGGADGLFEGGARRSAEVGVAGNAGMLVEGVVVVAGGFSDRADQAGRVHVDVGVGGRKDGVGGAYDRADLICHDAVGLRWIKGGLMASVAVVGKRLRED